MTDTPTPIVLEDVLDHATKLSQEMPDFVYLVDHDKRETCKYTRGGCPTYPDHCGCIIGQAILKATPPSSLPQVKAALQKLDDLRTAGFTSLVRLFNNPKPYDDFGEQGVKFVVRQQNDDDVAALLHVTKLVRKLSAIQESQDGGRSWQVALTAEDDNTQNVKDEVLQILSNTNRLGN